MVDRVLDRGDAGDQSRPRQARKIPSPLGRRR